MLRLARYLRRMGVFRGFLDLVVPRICVVCEERLLEREDGPSEASSDVRIDPVPDPFFCRDCRAEILQPGLRYSDCDDVPFVSWIGFLGGHEGALKRAVAEMKFRGGVRLARHLGRLLGWRLPPDLLRPNLLVPVPLSWWRASRRGFNQAEEIARGLGEELGLNVRTDLVRARGRLLPQHRRSLHGRLAGSRSSYALAAPWAVQGRRVGLVDDVTTSGATMGAVAGLLRRAGAECVTAFVLARTRRKRAAVRGL